jgi:hypothetical protein
MTLNGASQGSTGAWGHIVASGAKHTYVVNDCEVSAKAAQSWHVVVLQTGVARGERKQVCF